MAKPPLAPPCACNRARIINRIAELNLGGLQVTNELGFSPWQVSRLRAREDVFTLDRLIDAAANIGITVRMSATQPYRHR